jgi:hypothetical protein
MSPTRSSSQPPYERVVGSLIAIWIVGLISYLILSDRDFDPARIYFLKILLSLSCGILVATLPGFFNVDLNVPGFAVRAAGGAAAFVFVYTQSPSVPQLGLAPPDIKLNRLNTIDFRSVGDPRTDQTFLSGQIAITVPLELKNERQPSVIGTLQRTDLKFTLGERAYLFRWFYFVSLLPIEKGSWLTSEDTIRRAAATDLPPGRQFSEEIMHLSQDSPRWVDFVSLFKALDDDWSLSLIVLLNSGEVTLECKVRPSLYKSRIQSIEQQLGRVPGRISAVCEA